MASIADAYFRLVARYELELAAARKRNVAVRKLKCGRALLALQLCISARAEDGGGGAAGCESLLLGSAGLSAGDGSTA